MKTMQGNTKKADLKAIEESIDAFGMCDPIGIWSDKNVIVEGHGRLLALKDLGYTEAPCIRLDHLTDEQRRAYALAHNKTAELSAWDDEALPDELKKLQGIIDMNRFGFDDLEEMIEELEHENPYSGGVKIPHYEPTGEEVAIDELYDNSKAQKLLEDIEAAKIPDDIKTFLRYAAYRHVVFNFKKIAEFYANSDPDIQKLFEDSALVIIDINDAIAKGWVRLSKTVEDLIEYEE